MDIIGQHMSIIMSSCKHACSTKRHLDFVVNARYRFPISLISVPPGSKGLQEQGNWSLFSHNQYKVNCLCMYVDLNPFDKYKFNIFSCYPSIYESMMLVSFLIRIVETIGPQRYCLSMALRKSWCIRVERHRDQRVYHTNTLIHVI